MRLVKLVRVGGQYIAKVTRSGRVVGWFIGLSVGEVMEQMKGAQR